MASAGTIFDENTTSSNPATNTTPATESICPSGWTLPNRTQIKSIGNSSTTYVSSFSPVLGGRYDSGTLFANNTRGFWWSSDAYTGPRRIFMNYHSDGGLFTDTYGRRRDGVYIRCVAKQKTITDLAYMQDVTDEVIR